MLTQKLLSLNPEEGIFDNMQFPIDGVPMPDYNTNTDEGGIKYGIIEGTNIGYIYITTHFYENVNEEFYDAVLELTNTEGLIIDLRYNFGGYISQSLNSGIGALLSAQNTHTLTLLERCDKNTLFALCESSIEHNWFITGEKFNSYEGPIAILVGPNCFSMGEITAYRLQNLPTAKFFGKSTKGGLSGYSSEKIFRDCF